MMNLDRKNKAGMVITVSDIVLLPGMIHTLKLNNISEEELENLANEDKFSIALSLKQNFNQSQLKEEDFYRIGVSFHVNGVKKTEKGHEVIIKVLDRVEIKGLSIRNDSISAEFEISPEVIDLTENSQGEMLEYMKKVTREVSENFKGSDKFMTMIEDQKDLNKLIGHLTQFMPLSNQEKYDLIETQSLKERSLKFMDYILTQKETLKLQFEMTEKLTEKA
ncbi:MAG TPA: LON peptidase substrate-binding domain-containing protein, partial [Clostridium sp.]